MAKVLVTQWAQRIAPDERDLNGQLFETPEGTNRLCLTIDQPAYLRLIGAIKLYNFRKGHSARPANSPTNEIRDFAGGLGDVGHEALEVFQTARHRTTMRPIE